MYKNTKPLFLLCETPLHAGSGSDLGIVDLPIQRERHTSYPKVEASSLKGALRESFESAKGKNDDEEFQVNVQRFFGFDEDGKYVKALKEKLDNDKPEYAGCIGFSDARILLFPVKSLHGVFAWITCPWAINRFIHDISLGGKVEELPDEGELRDNSVPSSSRELYDAENRIILEEYIFTDIKPCDKDAPLDKFVNFLSEKAFEGNPYLKEKIKTNVIVIDDDSFRDFVNLSTEVITRTKIDNHTGTVKDGALFNEEYLPAESLMYSMLSFKDEFRKDGVNNEAVLSFFEEGLKVNSGVFQLGGNASLGKGLIRSSLVNPKSK